MEPWCFGTNLETPTLKLKLIQISLKRLDGCPHPHVKMFMIFLSLKPSEWGAGWAEGQGTGAQHEGWGCQSCRVHAAQGPGLPCSMPQPLCSALRHASMVNLAAIGWSRLLRRKGQ